MPDDLETQPTVNDVMEGLGEELTDGYVPDLEEKASGTEPEGGHPEGEGEGLGSPPAAAELNEDGTPKVPVNPEQKPDEAAPAADPKDVPPDTWRPDAKAEWAKLSPVAKAEIQKREQDIARYATQVRGPVQIAERFGKLIEPMVTHYEKHGHEPWSMVESALQAQAVLSYGTPEQKVAMFKEVAKECGIDVSALAQEGPAAANTELAQLRQQVQELQAQTTGVVSHLSAARQAEVQEQVNAFADDPKNVYFEQVAPQIDALLRQDPRLTLEEAYKTAVQLNPVTRQKEIDRLVAEKAAKDHQAAQVRAEAARKAARTNVVSSGRGRAAPPAGSVDETLRQAYDEIQARG
jgi:hypothetical protein